MLINKYLVNSELGIKQRIKRDDIDMKFLIPRLECRSTDIYTVQGRTSVVPPFCLQFCRVKGQEHIYALACEDGEIIFKNSNLPAKDTHIKSWSAHENAVFDVCWLSHVDQLITVSGDHSVLLWDTTTLQKIKCFKGHGSSVKTISLKPDNENVFVTGGRDGNILLWDSRCQTDHDHEPIGTISGAHDAAPQVGKRKRFRRGTAPSAMNPLNSITSVCFQDENLFLSTGASDWSIKCWDARWLRPNALPLFNVNNACENRKNHGYTSLIMNPNGRSFFANCTDGTISQYEVSRKNPSLISTYHGHFVETYFVKIDISCNGRFLVSGSSDEKAYIWQVDKPGAPMFTLEGHDAEVTAVAWHPKDITKLLTCADDEQVFHWKVGFPSDTKDVENPVVGLSQKVKPEEVRLPSHRHLNTPLTYVTPSSRSSQQSQMTPSTAGKSSPMVPRLTNWFTPKNKTTDLLELESTPANKSTSSEVVTPIKIPTRPVFSELGNGSETKAPGISNIRRTINFGSKGEQKPAVHHHAKKAKLAANPSNYSIRNFFHAAPRSLV